ncbi:hypothetical protein MesoLj131c_73980 (plasmid) [Mesorhizobium sp. 131-3-5]|uniref:class I SAM-dependent methyltransferase n=1 Tax=Mesorhizobium sp. 131-3-5 TaxID=2744520 RepID=UPI0018ED4217|nr:class I SAM-dependent methyltransferase [Mesorhizobium sp. 131-3-5]BCH13140.1 hypothetical protein MesoLj131c_73980 [Mesorhizobium sp. 131-3-5]
MDIDVSGIRAAKNIDGFGEKDDIFPAQSNIRLEPISYAFDATLFVGGTMKSDQELFAKGLATYQKVVVANYMAHREVYETLRHTLLDEVIDEFVFADLACGTAPGSASALTGTPIARYIGVDISQESLDVAKQALAPLTCPVELRCEDFVAAIDSWKGPLDVVWIGQSLHHLLAHDKVTLMRKIRDLLPPGGLFMIWEPTRLEGEDREGWLERFHQVRPEWSGVTDEEFAAFESHCRASDYSETAATWIRMGHEAGFRTADELMIVPNRLARVYRFRN